MGATNRKDVLDAALTRPGRFDRSIEVRRPDFQGRLEAVKVGEMIWGWGVGWGKGGRGGGGGGGGGGGVEGEEEQPVVTTAHPSAGSCHCTRLALRRRLGH